MTTLDEVDRIVVGELCDIPVESAYCTAHQSPAAGAACDVAELVAKRLVARRDARYLTLTTKISLALTRWRSVKPYPLPAFIRDLDAALEKALR